MLLEAHTNRFLCIFFAIANGSSLLSQYQWPCHLQIAISMLFLERVPFAYVIHTHRIPTIQAMCIGRWDLGFRSDELEVRLLLDIGPSISMCATLATTDELAMCAHA